jgi:metal-responsive CopG/Arc/MetJ family transcriptional regulator
MMAKARKNISFTDKQVERLEQMSKEENLSEAEIVRRALDAYLAWNDPMYQPTLPRPPIRNGASSPA